VKKHLEDLGFHVGGQVSVINSLGENLIVKVKESRVAVSDPLDASKPAGSSDKRSGQ
jgi:ferrous iron transport protein A